MVRLKRYSDIQKFWFPFCACHTYRCVTEIREFKQIATAGADTAAGSKFPQKCDTAHVRRLHPTVARNLTT